MFFSNLFKRPSRMRWTLSIHKFPFSFTLSISLSLSNTHTHTKLVFVIDVIRRFHLNGPLEWICNITEKNCLFALFVSVYVCVHAFLSLCMLIFSKVCSSFSYRFITFQYQVFLLQLSFYFLGFFFSSTLFPNFYVLTVGIWITNIWINETSE